tara:strand:+ start:2122 stop:2370 length:249 start_codon:yes stop_codon:yes gene_type:complete
MAQRWDVSSPRKGREGKTFWVRVGSAFQGDKGINIVFDALPLPDETGRVSVSLFEPRERQATPAPAKASGSYADDLDDEIAF